MQIVHFLVDFATRAVSVELMPDFDTKGNTRVWKTGFIHMKTEKCEASCKISIT